MMRARRAGISAGIAPPGPTIIASARTCSQQAALSCTSSRTHTTPALAISSSAPRRKPRPRWQLLLDGSVAQHGRLGGNGVHDVHWELTSAAVPSVTERSSLRCPFPSTLRASR